MAQRPWSAGRRCGSRLGLDGLCRVWESARDQPRRGRSRQRLTLQVLISISGRLSFSGSTRIWKLSSPCGEGQTEGWGSFLLESIPWVRCSTSEGLNTKLVGRQENKSGMQGGLAVQRGPGGVGLHHKLAAKLCLEIHTKSS